MAFHRPEKRSGFGPLERLADVKLPVKLPRYRRRLALWSSGAERHHRCARRAGTDWTTLELVFKRFVRVTGAKLVAAGVEK